MNVSNGNTQYEEKLNVLERLGILLMDLTDIKKQESALYAQRKAKEAEISVLYEHILLETRKGSTVYQLCEKGMETAEDTPSEKLWKAGEF